MENFPEYVASVFAEANTNICLWIGELANREIIAAVIDIMNVVLRWLQFITTFKREYIFVIFVWIFILFCFSEVKKILLNKTTKISITYQIFVSF